MNNKKSSGIYRITNKINGKYYIGSSDNITGTTGRWMEHINSLNAKRHDNDYLQKSWNKYGKDVFEFAIIEIVPKSSLLIVEQKYLNEAKKDGKKCYNLNFLASGGGFVGHKHTDSSKKKISDKLIGRMVSEKTKKRQSDSLKGRKPGFANKHHSEEWKLKNSQRMKKYWANR